MVIFQYNLYIFGIHLRTVLYPNPCYNEPCYKEVVVYITHSRMFGMLQIQFSAMFLFFFQNYTESLW